MLNTDTNDRGKRVAVASGEDLAITLALINRKLDSVVEVTEDLGRQLQSFDDFREDFVPIAHEGILIAYRKLQELEQAGVIDFLKESARVLHTISTSFTPDDVQALGDNVVNILRTVRGLTQPEVLDLADRAAGALRETLPEPMGRIGLLRSFRDPEVRRGLTLLLTVLRELGSQEEAGESQN